MIAHVWFPAQVEDSEDCKEMFFRMGKASLRLGIPECVGDECNCVDDTKNVSTLPHVGDEDTNVMDTPMPQSPQYRKAHISAGSVVSR